MFGFLNCFPNKYIFNKNKLSYINKIPIAFTPDKNFILPTIVSITSLLKNKNFNTYYIVNVIFIQNFSNDELNLFIQLGNKFDNWELNFIKINNIFNNLPTNENLPHSTYIRLIFSSLFKDYSKIIYLDGDTIILKDLYKMYNININQFYFVGQFSNGIKFEKYFNYSTHYINAGVLLINLLQQRKDNAEEKILKWAEKNKNFLTLKDQTIINYCFIDKIGLLPPEYGIFSDSFEFYIERTNNFTLGNYNYSEYKKAYNDPAIVHFHTPNKPWKKNSKKRYYDNYWWEYAKFSGIYDILLNNLKIKYFFGIYKNNNENIYLENYLLYFGQIKLLSYFNYSKFINIENIDKYNGTKLKVIINKIINDKIPSKNIIPIFISFEINKNNYKKKVLKYLKKNEPIGCNNIFTLNFLKEKNISSYYSGSYLTLLGYKNLNKNFNNKIFLDLNLINSFLFNKDLIEIFTNYKNEEYIFIKNTFSSKLNEEEKYKYTENLMNDISFSKLVLTSNINIALICIGYKTPVILILNNIENYNDYYNFEFFNKIFNLYGFYNNKVIKNFKFDKNKNIINKYLDIKILNNIENKFKEFIKIN